jgi:hypothetical protein
MTTSTIKNELMNLEKQYWDALKTRDAGTVAKLSDESCIVVNASGVMDIDRPTMAQMLQSDLYELKSYDIDAGSVQVREIGPDTALVAYSVMEEMVVEGKPVMLQAHDSSLWKRQGGSWVCSLHTESIAGDGFGRDRK